jgi:hypothetical protein
MKQVDSSQIRWRCLLALVSLSMLSQCALPPGTAWTVIRRDGVKDYWAISWGKKPVPDYVKELVPEAFGETRRAEDSGETERVSERKPSDLASGDEFPPLPSSMPEDWERPVEPVFPLMSTDPPEFPSLTPPMLVQNEAPNLPLESVQTEADESAHVHVPDFLNKTGEGSPGTEVGTSKPAPGLKMKDVALVSGEMQGSGATAASPVETPVTPAESVAVASTQPKNLTKVDEAPPVKRVGDMEKFLPVTPGLSAGETIPFGILVAGRPGYVRSPFAKAHQLVDVTGLKVGESVTCPFSGKPFRVPSVAEAMNQVSPPTEEVKVAEPVQPKEVPKASE